MAVARVVPKTKQLARAQVLGGPAKAVGSAPLVASVLEEARQAGLFDGEKTEHVSFRVPAALLRPPSARLVSVPPANSVSWLWRCWRGLILWRRFSGAPKAG